MNIQPDTIIRTIILALAIINEILTDCGRNPLPISESDAYELLTHVAMIAASAWAWWKNNSFTRSAIEADKYMHHLKNQKEREEKK